QSQGSAILSLWKFNEAIYYRMTRNTTNYRCCARPFESPTNQTSLLFIMQASLSMAKDGHPNFAPTFLIEQLVNSATRENALVELSSCRENIPELALLLWNTPSNQSQIPNYLYPCLNASQKGRPFEYLRLTCLGVIGALVKNDSPDVVEALLQTEIVAIFIIQKILLDDAGLDYICQTYERFFSVTTVLNSMALQLVEQKSLRLVKHVVRCYLRLADNKKYMDEKNNLYYIER
ncbi:Cell differentiation protein rcd1, partial [Paramicrosporidium saccamoebae]